MLCKPRNKRANAVSDENEKEVRRDPREFHNWAGRGAAKIILPGAVSFLEVRTMIVKTIQHLIFIPLQLTRMARFDTLIKALMVKGNLHN